MYELHKTSQRTEAQVNNSAKIIENLKLQAEDAKKGQQILLEQNEELKNMSLEANIVRLKLLKQNEELKEKLEHQEREFKLQQQQDDKNRLSAFENVLEVSSCSLYVLVIIAYHIYRSLTHILERTCLLPRKLSWISSPTCQ